MSARQRPRPARPRRGGAAVPAWTGRAQAPAMHTAPAAPRCRAEADELRIGDDQLVNVIGTSVQIDNLAGERTGMTDALVLGSGGVGTEDRRGGCRERGASGVRQGV